jgi:hypothetical protein
MIGLRRICGSPLAPFGGMSGRITVVVEGIEEGALVGEIEKTIHDAFRATAIPGAWHITVKPSRVRGHWDFSIHGVGKRHSLSIAVPPALLWSLIPQRFQEALEHLYPGMQETVQSERPTLRAV